MSGEITKNRKTVLDKFKQVTTFVFDVDGVLTNGNLFLLGNGLMARQMNIRDGYALQLAVKRGYRVLVISGGDSPEVKERLSKLGIADVWMKAEDKAAILRNYMEQNGLTNEVVLYMGDDIPDHPVMLLAGLPCCPADAVQEIKEVSVYMSHIKGGDGCARDVIEKVMKLRGDWGEDTSVRAQ